LKSGASLLILGDAKLVSAFDFLCSPDAQEFEGSAVCFTSVPLSVLGHPLQPLTSCHCFSFCMALASCHGVSFSRDIQDPPGQGPVRPAVGDPASAGGLD